MDAKDDLAEIYYGTTKDAEVDFSDIGESYILVDLGNSGAYGTGISSFYNVKQATGARGAENDLAGEDNKGNVLVGGADGTNRLYGGKGGNDRLVGNRTSEDTFYFGADSGYDTVQAYTEDDTIAFLGGSLSRAYMDKDGHLKMYWQDETGNQSRLNFDEDMKDMVVTYEYAGEKHGAKFGGKITVTDDTDSFVNYYNSGSSTVKGDLEVSGDNKKTIWLDGSHGVVYDGFSIVDARKLAGDAEIAGGSKSDSIIGGSGSNSLWGGAGGNDILTGGTSYNEFYFGMGEGKDTITSSNVDDKVMLYNVSIADIDAKNTGVKNGNMVIALNDGSSLTIQNYSRQGATTFQLSDGTYSYNKSTGTWS